MSPSKIAHEKLYIYCPPLLLNEMYAHAVNYKMESSSQRCDSQMNRRDFYQRLTSRWWCNCEILFVLYVRRSQCLVIVLYWSVYVLIIQACPGVYIFSLQRKPFLIFSTSISDLLRHYFVFFSIWRQITGSSRINQGSWKAISKSLHFF